MTKSELRKIYKSKRQELLPDEIQNISLLILENLKSMNIWQNSNFHIFIPIPGQNEINTFPIIDYLFQLSKNIIVPKIKDGKMLNCLIDENVEWQTGKFSIPEPKEFHLVDSKEIEVVFLPMLICDQKGNRIGYGGGFYDRFLANFKIQPTKIGLSFFAPVEGIDDIQDTDVPLDYCITGDRIVSFTD